MLARLSATEIASQSEYLQRVRKMMMMKRLLATGALALTATACGISTQQEVEMGQQYSAQINQQLPIMRDPEINRYINVLGDSIARLTSRGDLDWHFYIVDDPDVNAFAVPGGYVYVYRGLIERATRMDELAGAMGHEIGHVVMRHSVKQMEKMQGAQVGVTAVCVLLNTCQGEMANAAINIGGAAVFAKFSRDDERQADEVGVQNVVRAGIDPRGMIDLFQVLINERKQNPSALDTWFASHPMEEDRITDVNNMIAKIPPAVLRSLSKDSPNYQRFRQRLMAQPHVQSRRARSVG